MKINQIFLLCAIGAAFLAGCQQGEAKPEENAGSPQAGVEVPVSGEQKAGGAQATKDAQDGLSTGTK